MKNLKIILLFIFIIIIGVTLFFFLKKTPQASLIPNEERDSILGCYVVRFAKDVYTMRIQNEKENIISGTMDFNNFEKDSSSGSFSGVYQDGILLIDYSFNSEGMDSLMQLIFKKSGENFIRGYGEVDSEGTHFVDPKSVTYDEASPLSLFKKESCSEITN